MELHHARYFIALAETRNYTLAAQKCFITRQAMRQTVQALEREFNVKLVENRKNRLFLTPAGALFAQKAEALLSAGDALEAAMRAFVTDEQRVRMGISVSLLPFYAPEVLREFNDLRQPFPALRLERVVADADALLDQLALGELDMAVAVDLGCSPPGLCRTVLRRDDIGILLSVDHPLSSRDALRLEDLDGQSLSLMSRPERCFEPLWRALKANHIRVEYRVIPESIEAFQLVRKEGLLALDRMEYGGDDPIALEKDLPLADFPKKLETVLLYPAAAAPMAHMLARYL